MSGRTARDAEGVMGVLPLNMTTFAVRSLMLLGVLLLPSVHGTAVHGHAGTSATASGEATFRAAVARLERSPRFTVHASWPYPGRSRPFTTDISYGAPHRLLVSRYLGHRSGNKVTVQIGGTSCSWNTGPTFHRIYCSRTAWNSDVVTQALRSAVPTPYLTHARYGSTSTPTRVTVTVQGMGLLFRCPPDAICSPFAVKARPYKGVLVVDRSSGLPRSFTISATTGSRVGRVQAASFTYPRTLHVALPRGKRVGCQWWATPQQWCLAR